MKKIKDKRFKIKESDLVNPSSLIVNQVNATEGRV